MLDPDSLGAFFEVADHFALDAFSHNLKQRKVVSATQMIRLTGNAFPPYGCAKGRARGKDYEGIEGI